MTALSHLTEIFGEAGHRDADAQRYAAELLTERDIEVLREAATDLRAGNTNWTDDIAAQVVDEVAEWLERRAAGKDTSVGSQSVVGESTQAADLLALATILEVPRPGAAPLQLRRSYAGGDRWAICDRTGRRWHREFGFVYEAQNVLERDRTDTRFPLAEAVPLAQKLAAGVTS